MPSKVFWQEDLLQEMKFLIQENSIPLDLTVCTDGLASEDQQGWSFIVKQSTTIIHEDSASSVLALTAMDTKAVTRAFRWSA